MKKVCGFLEKMDPLTGSEFSSFTLLIGKCACPLFPVTYFAVITTDGKKYLDFHRYIFSGPNNCPGRPFPAQQL